MEIIRRLRWSGPPLALQIMGLLMGGLIVAQLVTLFLTLVLPPAPQPQYSFSDIARAFSGAPVQARDRPLEKSVRNSPPAPTGPGWFMADRARHDLAMQLGRDDADVQLYFYSPLPFADTARLMPGPPPPMLPPHQADTEPQPVPPVPSEPPVHRRAQLPPGFMYADYQIAQAGPAMNFPGGVYPGAGFPNGGPAFPGSMPRTLPSGGFPGRVMPGTPATRSAPGHDAPSLSAPNTAPGLGPGFSRPDAAPFAGAPATTLAPRLGPESFAAPVITNVPALPRLPEPNSGTRAPKPTEMEERPQARPEASTPPAAIVPQPEPQAPAAPAPQPRPAQRSSPVVNPPIEVQSQPRALFGLMPAPFVQGDFIASLRLSRDQWAVVQPAPEPFPNAWQRRVLLWFVISFALVAPLGWLFARQVVRPITGFAVAAERLGRDPTASILAASGPAEVGRAATAFNRMQSRLRSFVDDRTAMVGAISHDLRTPLTRLRFRIEDVAEPQRHGLLAEVNEMEAMISSVINFIREASEPGRRETLDLRSIVEDVVEDAVFIGKDVRLEDSERAPVEVDALGMRRLLSNLVENAVKYGDKAQVRLFTDRQDAVAEIRDNGPGLPEEEMERVFQPFYRAPNAHASGKKGSGLGLAVCRSIARAHGGDVRLSAGEHGLVAQLRVPLAYGRS